MQGNKNYRTHPELPVIYQDDNMQKPFFYNIIEAIPLPLLVIELDCQIALANRAAGRLYPGNRSDAGYCYRLINHLNSPCRDMGYPCPLDIIRETGKPVILEKNYINKDGNPTPVEVCAMPVVNPNGAVVRIVVLIIDTAKPQQEEERLSEMGACFLGSSNDPEKVRKQALKELRKSREFNLAVLNSLSAHIAVLDKTGKIVAVNEAWKQFGLENGADPAIIYAAGLSYTQFCKPGAENGDTVARKAITGVQSVLKGTLPHFSMEYPCHSPWEKRWFIMQVTTLSGLSGGGAVISHQLITDRKKNEERQEAELAMLTELANFSNLKQALRNVLNILAGVTGCQAAAIRLNSGEDYTYYAHRGFPARFIEQEFSICVSDRNESATNLGGPVLECLCGKVLQDKLTGSVDHKYTTPFGSFFTGHSSALKNDTNGPLKLEGPWRLNCIQSGYETIALVPIKDKEDNIGLLQLNGTCKNLIKRDDLSFLELACRYIASAIRHMKDSEALQESEERYRRLAENAPDVIYRVGMSPRRFEYVNPAIEHMTGYTPDDYYADTELGFRIIHPEDRKVFNRLLDLDTDFSAPVELRWIGKCGRVIWTEQRNLPIRDRDGRVVAMEGIARDITERKKVEYSQQKQAQYERTMTTAMSIFTGNHNSRDALEKLLQLLASRQDYKAGAYYTYDEWSRSLNMTAARSLSASGPAGSFVLGNNAITGAVLKKEVLLLRREEKQPQPAGDGLQNLFDLSTTAVLPVYYQDKLQGVLLLGADREPDAHDKEFLERIAIQLGICLHGIKQFEYLKTLSRQLAARQKEIEKKNRELEQANRAKSEFLTNMSHELRTPLNSVIGFSELLEKQIFGALNPRQQEYVKDIWESGEHLLELINDILDLSKIEAGTMELDLNDFHMPGLLQGCLRMFREKALKKNIRLEMMAEDNIGVVVADSRKIKQVIFNLLTNAVKFTTEGGEVLLSAYREGQNVTVCVTDNGIGISRKEMDKLFKEFSQVDGSLSRRHEGTGLGLALSKKLVEMHGGTIGVESQPQKGSRFYFTIPAQPGGVAGPENSPPRPENPPPRAGSPDEPPLVLVVEDNDRDAKLIETYLINEGFRVARAANGREGFDMAARLRPQVITMDILMPVMDGWQLLEKLRGDCRLNNVPVLIVSMLHEYQKGLAFGASEVLLKPFDPENLVDIVRNLAGSSAYCQPASTVLVIDDDPRAVDLIEQNLRAKGHNVLKAHGGAEGLKTAREEKIDLILLDLMMPEIDGFEVVKKLKENPGLKNVPVIILTAKILTADDFKKLRGLVESVREKGDYNPDSFLSEINRVLQRQSSGR